VAKTCYRTLNASDILLSSGAFEALVACALAFSRGDRPVFALEGAYPSDTTAARLAGAKLSRSSDYSDVTCALATNPDVPDGLRFDVSGFIRKALSLGAAAVIDEVYRHIVLDRGAIPDAAADVYPDAVSIGDLSKPVGLGGLRVGWVATRNPTERPNRVLFLS
jgi:aspartate/methionine/tyrosine aminotransferase